MEPYGNRENRRGRASGLGVSSAYPKRESPWGWNGVGHLRGHEESTVYLKRDSKALENYEQEMDSI